MEDIPQWLNLVNLVIDGFPCLDNRHYISSLQNAIRNKRSLIIKDGNFYGKRQEKWINIGLI